MKVTSILPVCLFLLTATNQVIGQAERAPAASSIRHRRAVAATKKITIVANPMRNGRKCEGDCDDDSDCAGDLICFHREKKEFKDVPGCLGGDEDGSRTDYCVDPADVANLSAFYTQDEIYTATESIPSAGAETLRRSTTVLFAISSSLGLCLSYAMMVH